MTHRERVLAAVSHKQPDKVPIDLGGTRDSSLVVEAYEKVKKYFEVETEDRLCDRMMRVVHVDERILRAFDIDTRAVFPGAPSKGLGQELGPHEYRDAWGSFAFIRKEAIITTKGIFPYPAKSPYPTLSNTPGPTRTTRV